MPLLTSRAELEMNPLTGTKPENLSSQVTLTRQEEGLVLTTTHCMTLQKLLPKGTCTAQAYIATSPSAYALQLQKMGNNAAVLDEH